MSNDKPPLPVLEKKNKERLVEEIRTYEVITPIFGGGVEKQNEDPITRIRVPSIRGQLRFWWRATKGQQYSTVEELYEKESEIWGSTKRPSSVILFVNMSSNSNKKKLTMKKKYSYIAFSLKKEANISFEYGYQFELHLRYPKDKQEDVEAALWAWEMFGGIGGRTRRGFGSIALIKLKRNGKEEKVPQLPNTFEEVEEYISQQLEKYLPEKSSSLEIPKLSSEKRLKCAFSDKDQRKVWKKLIKQYKDFRSSFAKDKKKSPELEKKSIHEIIKKKNPGQSTNYKCPRGQFGLPIVFQFKKFPTFVLEPTESERWASPLIMKVIRCAKDKYVGLFLELDSPEIPKDDVSLYEIIKDKEGTKKEDSDNSLKRKEKIDINISLQLTKEEADQIPLLKNDTNVIDAFFKSLPLN